MRLTDELEECVQRKHEGLWSRVQEDVKLVNDNIDAWHAWRRRWFLSLFVGGPFLIAVGLLLPGFFDSAVALCGGISLLAEGKAALKTGFSPRGFRFARRPLAGEQARNLGSIQVLLGVAFLVAAVVCAF